MKSRNYKLRGNSNVNHVNIKREDSELKCLAVSNRGFKNFKLEIPINVSRFNAKLKSANSFDIKSFHHLNFTVSDIETDSFESEKVMYHRTIIPIESNYHWIFNFHDEVYSCETHHSRNFLSLDICSSKWNVYIKKLDQCPSALILEGLSPINYKTHMEYVFTISKALGFLSGMMHFDDAITYQSSTVEFDKFGGFKYSKLRGSINLFYEPVFSNPHAYTSLNEKEASTLEKYQHKLSQDHISRLCSEASEHKKFGDILLLLIESTQGSTLTIPALQSVVLEALTKYLRDVSVNSPKPIEEKKLAKKVRKELLSVVAYNSEDIVKGNSEGVKILQIKIDNINSSTNRDKLTAPFKKLGIFLTDEDIAIIGNRNNFLHGNIDVKFKQGSINDMDEALKYSMLRILLLNSMLILRHIGYRHSLVNYCRVYMPKYYRSRNENIYRLN